MGKRMSVLFLIHDLGQGGAEKVLVNLVNNMDRTKFDISVIALFGGGINEQFLKKDINFHSVFPKEIPGNSKLMKALTPNQLHNICVKGQYDIEIAYLEGPATRVISGCQNLKTKLICWIHVEQHTKKIFASHFRSYQEAVTCYKRFDKVICVSEFVKKDFCSLFKPTDKCVVLYNTVESGDILKKSKENVKELQKVNNRSMKLVAVGSLKESKGYDRLLRIVNRLCKEQYSIQLYILGIGPLQKVLQKYVYENNLCNAVIFLGYQINPYKYVAKCDLFICASYAEGFSTAVTEALIVGTPVCSVEVSGMRELLGNNEYGVITENDENALYRGIKSLLDDPEKIAYYKKQASIRGKAFSTEETVKAVETMLLNI